jgi:hypothetical protein
MLDVNQPSMPRRDPWNKGRLIGQKRPLKPKEVWSIRVRLHVERLACEPASNRDPVRFRCKSLISELTIIAG